MGNGTAVEQTGGMPAWVMAMRQAAQKHVTEADIEEIVKGQVAAAKKGDRNAIRFVFEQVLSGAPKGGTYVQNNFYGQDTPAKTTRALPGTKDKIETMRQRVAAGESAFKDGDGRRDAR